jgi:hypothetical protein
MWMTMVRQLDVACTVSMMMFLYMMMTMDVSRAVDVYREMRELKTFGKCADADAEAEAERVA